MTTMVGVTAAPSAWTLAYTSPAANISLAVVNPSKIGELWVRIGASATSGDALNSPADILAARSSKIYCRYQRYRHRRRRGDRVQDGASRFNWHVTEYAG